MTERVGRRPQISADRNHGTGQPRAKRGCANISRAKRRVIGGVRVARHGRGAGGRRADHPFWLRRRARRRLVVERHAAQRDPRRPRPRVQGSDLGGRSDGSLGRGVQRRRRPIWSADGRTAVAIVTWGQALNGRGCGGLTQGPWLAPLRGWIEETERSLGGPAPAPAATPAPVVASAPPPAHAPAPAPAPTPQAGVKIPPENRAGYDVLCREDWTKRGILDKGMYDYCMSKMHNAYTELVVSVTSIKTPYGFRMLRIMRSMNGRSATPAMIPWWYLR